MSYHRSSILILASNPSTQKPSCRGPSGSSTSRLTHLPAFPPCCELSPGVAASTRPRSDTSSSSPLLSSTSSSNLSDHSKPSVLTAVPADSTVFATATARIYHLPFGSSPDNWSYSGLSGTLVFGRSCKLSTGPGTTDHHVHWFRMTDPLKGLIWMHEIPSALDYALDKPFFHTFSGKVCSIKFFIASTAFTILAEQDVWFPLRR